MNQRLLKADVAAAILCGSSSSGMGLAKLFKLSRDKLNDEALRANMFKDSAVTGVKAADKESLMGIASWKARP